jgi:hypothetical protein
MEATVAATFSQQRPRFHKLEHTPVRMYTRLRWTSRFANPDNVFALGAISRSGNLRIQTVSIKFRFKTVGFVA